MQYFFLILSFLFGAAIGSFIAVIADRYNTGLSFFKGRSLCFSCGTELKNRDLFPVLSFLLLKGRCRYCGAKIPKETLAVEIAMGALSALAFIKSGVFGGLEFGNWDLESGIAYFVLLSIFAVILLISIYDLRHFIIPDSFLLALFFLSLLFSISQSLNLSMISFSALVFSILSAIFSGALIALPLLILFILSKGKWLGFGDVKYVLVLGFWLGLVQGLSGVVLAFWIGAAFSLLALSLQYFKSHFSLPFLKGRLTIKSEVPFGPFLSFGAVAAFIAQIDLFQLNSLLNL